MITSTFSGGIFDLKVHLGSQRTFFAYRLFSPSVLCFSFVLNEHNGKGDEVVFG